MISWTIQGRWDGTPITSTVDPTTVIYGGGGGAFIDPAPWVNKDATIALPSAAALAWATAVAVTQTPAVTLTMPFALAPGAPAAASFAIDFPFPYSSLPARQGDSFRQYGLEYGGAVDTGTGLMSLLKWA
jgi:hypothetical protein